MDRKCGSINGLQKTSPYEVYVISGIRASDTAGVELVLSLPVNGDRNRL